MDDFVRLKTLRAAIYGSVALVRHRASGRVYAMKVMSLAHMAAQRAVVGPVVHEDGNTELRVLRRLSQNRMVDRDTSVHATWECPSTLYDHHHLLTLHTDFVDSQAQARCLVFDYCPYGELYDQLQHAPMALRTARTCFRQIVTAVRFLHAQRIAHRDLSLENVLVDAHRQCRLGDFGLASEDGTQCAGRVGKPFYMAPEVYDWQPDEVYNGLHADAWSLGIILFILTTGAPPFEAAHEIDARFRVVKTKGIRELLAVWKLDGKLPVELCDLLEALLLVNPADRLDIDGVWNHPWLQGELDVVWEGFTHNDAAASTRESVNEPEQSEPQKDVESSGTSNERQRKRLKISVENTSVNVRTSTGRVAGFFGVAFADDEILASIGRPPELRHCPVQGRVPGRI